MGEFVVRGPQLMRGYWNSGEATDEVLRDGWAHTGDAGFIDQDGYIYVCERVNDMIISGGENIFPREIEDVLTKHADVAEAAIIGVPDAKWGEAVKGVVVLRDGATTTAEQLIEFCRGLIAPFKLPSSIDIVARLPRNATGKVLKRELRERYWRDCDRRVS
jgi:acyl-CoA synthetase (AMP-forming)/AMP-acid ligase II